MERKRETETEIERERERERKKERETRRWIDRGRLGRLGDGWTGSECKRRY